MNGKTKVTLSGVPETLLLTLYSRAVETKLRPHVLNDPESVRIFDSIDYDFQKSFGPGVESTALRAAMMDKILLAWIAKHPHGTVVALGEGLETQSRRVDNGQVKWITVDLPESIAVRERFLPPTPRFRHVAKSALDYAWMDEVDASKGLCIVAQGLLMYLEPDQVRNLLTEIGRRFVGAELIFDFIPEWMSKLTRRGLQLTKNYRLPTMPWFIDYTKVEATLREWNPGLRSVKLVTLDPFTHGTRKFLFSVYTALNRSPAKRIGIAHVVY